MLFGHNTDVKFGDNLYHVQTEDRGPSSPCIDTAVYCQGRVVHRRTKEYNDLLPLNAEQESLLKQRMDEQHAAVLEEVRSGAFPVESAAEDAKQESLGGRVAECSLSLELLNGKSWLNGKRADLHIAVRQQHNGTAVAGAKILVQVDGSAQPTEFQAKTGVDGTARLEFEMPELPAPDAALLFEATYGAARGQLRFQLRSKPRVREVV